MFAYFSFERIKFSTDPAKFQGNFYFSFKRANWQNFFSERNSSFGTLYRNN